MSLDINEQDTNEDMTSGINYVMMNAYASEVQVLPAKDLHKLLEYAPVTFATWFRNLNLRSDIDYVVIDREKLISVTAAIAVIRSSTKPSQELKNKATDFLVQGLINGSDVNSLALLNTVNAHVNAENALVEQLVTGVRNVLENYMTASAAIQEATYTHIGYPPVEVVNENANAVGDTVTDVRYADPATYAEDTEL